MADADTSKYPMFEDEDQTQSWLEKNNTLFIDKIQSQGGLICRILEKIPANVYEDSAGFVGNEVFLGDFIDKDKVTISENVFQAKCQYDASQTSDPYQISNYFTMDDAAKRPIFRGVNFLYRPDLEKDEALLAAVLKESEDITLTGGNVMLTESYVKAWALNSRNQLYHSYEPLPDYIEKYRKEGENSKPVILFIKPNFSVGIGKCVPNAIIPVKATDGRLQIPQSSIPAYYSIGFKNGGENMSVEFLQNSVPALKLTTKLDPEKGISVITTSSTPEPKKALELQLATPTILNDKQETVQPAKVETLYIDDPTVLIGYANIKGYKPSSFFGLPICSWTRFKNKMGSTSKVVQILEKTRMCGPFVKVRAKDRYTGEIMKILKSYTELEMKFTEEPAENRNKNIRSWFWEAIKKGVEYLLDGGRYYVPYVDWTTINSSPPFPTGTSEVKNGLGYVVGQLFQCIYKLGQKDAIPVFNSVDEVDDDLLYYNYRHEREGKTAYWSIAGRQIRLDKLFKEASLIKSVSFYRINDDVHDGHIFVRFYPGIFIEGARPMKDDYVIQYIPTYVKEEETNTSTAVVYVNTQDVLIPDTMSMFKTDPNMYTAKDSDKYPGNGKVGNMYSYKGQLVTESVKYIHVDSASKNEYTNPEEIVNVMPGAGLMIRSGFMDGNDIVYAASETKKSLENFKKTVKDGDVYVPSGENKFNWSGDAKDAVLDGKDIVYEEGDGKINWKIFSIAPVIVTIIGIVIIIALKVRQDKKKQQTGITRGGRIISYSEQAVLL